MQRILGTALVCTGLLGYFSAQGALVWRPGEGWVNEDATEEGPVAANSRDQLEAGKRLEESKDWKQAKTMYLALVRKWPFSFNSGEAQYRIGWCSEQQGDFSRAFKDYQKCVEKYPASEYFEKALERQYQIANLFLMGEPQRIWKMPLLPSWEQTAKMYDQIIKNAPYGRYAAESQFKIGLCNEKTKKWSEAITAYKTVLDRFPGHDIADDALYQIGYVWFQAAERPDYDQGAAEKAIQAFTEFIARFPNSDKVAQAKENLAIVHGRLTQGSFNIAKFYETQKKPDAAVIYYRDVVQKAPDSEMAKIALKRIEELTPMTESGPPMPKDLARHQERAAEAMARERGKSAQAMDEAVPDGPEFAGIKPRMDDAEPLPQAEAVSAPAVERANRPLAPDVALRKPVPAPAAPSADDEMIGPVLPEPAVQ
ncbi:MAG TPA: outer membrane protein assembly factor BamD [Verrucomicrobiae bacterium]|mgnify:CR=1 FL=1|nr:outer membrane protein assembly factor BamD [Verrucomicrobiae bacterium]